MNLNLLDQILGTIVTIFTIGLFLLYLILSLAGFNDKGFFIFLIPFVLTIFLCIILLVKYRKQNNHETINYLNIGVQRHLLGLFMIFYGIPKLFGGFFDYQLFALDSKLGSVSEFELAWYFYGKNPWQELFSGIMEFIPGILLMNRRTYYLGAVLLLPVTAQVFILNFFFKIGGITFPAAAVLLACNLYILYSEKEKIFQFIRSLDFTPKVTFTGKSKIFLKVCKWAIVSLAVLLVGMKIKNVVFKSGTNVKYENLVGVYTLEHMKRNDAEYTPTNESRYYKDLYIEKQSRWNILRKFDNNTNAFILELSQSNDSLKLFINKGGIGDSPDIKETETVLKGTYAYNKDYLTIKGTQMSDTLVLIYKKQDLRPKGWLW